MCKATLICALKQSISSVCPSQSSILLLILPLNCSYQSCYTSHMSHISLVNLTSCKISIQEVARRTKAAHFFLLFHILKRCPTNLQLSRPTAQVVSVDRAGIHTWVSVCLGPVPSRYTCLRNLPVGLSCSSRLGVPGS